MGNVITLASQLNLFDTIKTAILTDSVLSAKFGTGRIFEFEPIPKSASFPGLPYIVVNIPTNESDPLTMDQKTQFKPFTVMIELVMDQAIAATGAYRTYANKILAALEGAVTSFQTLGYYNLKATLEGSVSDTVKDKSCIRGTFSLTLSGVTNR